MCVIYFDINTLIILLIKLIFKEKHEIYIKRKDEIILY